MLDQSHQFSPHRSGAIRSDATEDGVVGCTQLDGSSLFTGKYSVEEYHSEGLRGFVWTSDITLCGMTRCFADWREPREKLKMVLETKQREHGETIIESETGR